MDRTGHWQLEANKSEKVIKPGRIKGGGSGAKLKVGGAVTPSAV